MQEGENEKTRILRAPPLEEKPAAPHPVEGADPNQTVIIQPSARAVAAAAALSEARRQRDAARKAEEFRYSGQVDFDITAMDLTPPPRKRWWQRPAVLAAVIAGSVLAAGVIWWGVS
ncbi:MAG: hypothetical protein HY749_10880 [Gammaproteobacteria bacterium]|nr:hypothetical protein [Gammaproteobacteria bacterium]MBI5616887.1 hypothetical protein [Gammaproteobacteria bacterium]